MSRISRCAVVLSIGLVLSSTSRSSEPSDPAADTVLKVQTRALQRGICHGEATKDEIADRAKLAQMAASLADPNTTMSSHGQQINAIDMAVLADDADLLNRLFAKGARIREENALMMLSWAVQYDSTATLVTLMAHGLDPNLRAGANLLSPLEAASLHDQTTNVYALVAAGARLDTPPNPKGFNVLTAVVICKNQHLADYLMAKGVVITDLTRQKAAENGITLAPAPSR